MGLQFARKLLVLVLIFVVQLTYISVYSQTNTPEEDASIAKQLQRNVTENGNLSDMIDNALPTLLPFGVSKEICGKSKQLF